MPLFKQECPICEFVFEIDEAEIEDSTAIRCAYCDHLFSPIRTERVADNLPVQVSRLRRRETTPETDASVTIGKSDNLRSSILVKRMQAKRRSNLILLILFLGAVASVAYLVYRFNNLQQQRQQQLSELNPNPTEAIDLSESTTLDTSGADSIPTPSQSSSGDAVAADAKSAPAATLPADPIQPPKFQFLSAANAADEAALTRPYLVLLEIESPAGIRFATGVIVDSRGYVATSLRAVAGAAKIKVSPAQKPAQIKEDATPPMSDSVRSVLAVSRSQQWVLLEINRRLVLNANDISIPTADRIVSRQPLLRVIAPQSPLDYVVSEMRVDSRKKSDDLTEKQAKLLESSELANESETNWILSPSSPYDRLGAALISADGKLMAMMVNSDERFSYFVSASEIAKRLRENQFDRTPLSELTQMQ